MCGPPTRLCVVSTCDGGSACADSLWHVNDMFDDLTFQCGAAVPKSVVLTVAVAVSAPSIEVSERHWKHPAHS